MDERSENPGVENSVSGSHIAPNEIIDTPLHDNQVTSDQAGSADPYSSVDPVSQHNEVQTDTATETSEPSTYQQPVDSPIYSSDGSPVIPDAQTAIPNNNPSDGGSAYIASAEGIPVTNNNALHAATEPKKGSSDSITISKKPILITLTVICVLALIAAAIIAFVMLSGPRMPDLRGMSPSDARVQMAEETTDVQLVFQTQEGRAVTLTDEGDYSEWVTESQNLEPEEKLDEITAVTVTIRPSDEYAKKREQAMTDFIDTQVEIYNWKKSQISYEDHGDVMTVRFTAKGTDSKYFPIGYAGYIGESEKSGQVEADQLASALGNDVVITYYAGKWLNTIIIGRSSQTPKDSIVLATNIAKEENKKGVSYAKKHRKTALNNFAKYCKTINCTCVARNVDGRYYIALVCKKNYEWTFKTSYRYMAKSAATCLQKKVALGFLDSRGTYKSYKASPTSFVYNKSTDKYMTTSALNSSGPTDSQVNV